MKKFNWKRYITHVLVSWLVFGLAMGAVVMAKEDTKAVNHNQFILNALHRRINDIETNLLLKSMKIVRLEQELEDVRGDNETLKRLNVQFVRENVRLRKQLMLERLARKEES